MENSRQSIFPVNFFTLFIGTASIRYRYLYYSKIQFPHPGSKFRINSESLRCKMGIYLSHRISRKHFITSVHIGQSNTAQNVREPIQRLAEQITVFINNLIVRFCFEKARPVNNVDFPINDRRNENRVFFRVILHISILDKHDIASRFLESPLSGPPLALILLQKNLPVDNRLRKSIIHSCRYGSQDFPRTVG